MESQQCDYIFTYFLAISKFIHQTANFLIWFPQQSSTQKKEHEISSQPQNGVGKFGDATRAAHMNLVAIQGEPLNGIQIRNEAYLRGRRRIRNFLQKNWERKFFIAPAARGTPARASVPPSDVRPRAPPRDRIRVFRVSQFGNSAVDNLHTAINDPVNNLFTRGKWSINSICV